MKEKKPKIAIHCLTGCSGCDVSILDLNDFILELYAIFDFIFWPICMDGKIQQIEMLEKEEIFISLLSGAVANEEDLKMSKLLREKSKYIISLGSCACFGGIPALLNLTDKTNIFKDIYSNCSNFSEKQINFQNIKLKNKKFPPLPSLSKKISSISKIIDVDYYVLGCPPTKEILTNFFNEISNKEKMPEKGFVFGSNNKNVCSECPRKKIGNEIEKIIEPHEINVDENICLLDQGVLCLGMVTDGGCSSICPNIGQPCRGCFGPSNFLKNSKKSIQELISSIVSSKNKNKNYDILSDIKDKKGYFYSFISGENDG